jgi:NAD(P) transhydrogenase
MPNQYDLTVIGAGPAGAQGAATAAALGKQVALVEREPYLGGAGLTTGTMPSKMLREAAVTLAALRQRGLASLRYALQPGTRLSDLMYHKDVVVQAAWGTIQRSCEQLNIHVVRGSAAFKDAQTIVVTPPDGEGAAPLELASSCILVATGSTSIRPPLFPFDHPRVHDTETILGLDRLPRSVVIVGGGAIGCEYASIFNALGVRVSLVEKQPRLLAPVDAELVQRWQQHLAGQGVDFHLGEAVAAVDLPTTPAGDVCLTLESGPVLAGEVVLVAVGRRGNVAGLNLAAAGLEASDLGHLPVDDHYQTRVPHIYAAGDVVGWPALASTSMAQGRAAMTRAFTGAAGDRAPLYPVAIYTIPELAMAGLSEEDCRAAGQAYAVGRAFFHNNPHAQITGESSGLLKLLFEPGSQRLLGAQIMCATASDLIHLGAHVLATGGTLAAFTQAVYNYPTLSQAYQAAALDGLERLAAQGMN